MVNLLHLKQKKVVRVGQSTRLHLKEQKMKRDLNTIMPMINKEVNTLETQYHVMGAYKKLTVFLSPGQTPIATSDQPVFPSTK